MSIPTRLAFAFLKSTLALYPERYRREYGEERACVLRLALQEAAAGGWLRLLGFCVHELRDLPFALLREYSKGWKLRAENIWDQLENRQESGSALLAGLFPFVLLGLTVLAYEIPDEWGNPGILYALGPLLLLGGYLLICIGLFFGALAGFPAWALPYLVYAVVFALFTGDGGSFSLVVFNIEVWGALRSFVPLAIVMVLVARLNRDPWALVDRLMEGVSKDWSRLAFGLYGLFPLIVFSSFEYVENAYSFPGAVAGAVLIITGAFLYLRLKSRFWRILGMVTFACLGILAVKATSTFYWATHYANPLTGERFLLEGPVPYAHILAEAARDTIMSILFLLSPGVGKMWGWFQQFGQSVSRRLPHSG